MANNISRGYIFLRNPRKFISFKVVNSKCAWLTYACKKFWIDYNFSHSKTDIIIVAKIVVIVTPLFQAIVLFKLKKHKESFDILERLLLEDARNLNAHYALVNFAMEVSDVEKVRPISCFSLQVLSMNSTIKSTIKWQV